MRILRKFLTPCCLIVGLITALASCSSNSPKTTESGTKNKAKSEWNYDQIRKARSEQKSDEALLPPPTQEEADNCVVLSAIQKKKSGASGCRPLDPREGFGENMFCCER